MPGLARIYAPIGLPGFCAERTRKGWSHGQAAGMGPCTGAAAWHRSCSPEIGRRLQHQPGGPSPAASRHPVVTPLLVSCTRLKKVGGEVVKHILLVDDHVFFGKAFAQLLEQSGYRVTAAGDGARDATSGPEETVDLVIVNLAKRGKTRLETIAALRQELPESKFIALSGGKREESWRARRLGVDHTFRTPFNTEEILDTIEEDLQASGFLQ